MPIVPELNKTVRADLAAWYVAGLRLTAFTDPLAPAALKGKGKTWEELVGVPPQNRQSRQGGLEHQEDGPLGGGRLTCKTVLRRIDWNLDAAPDLENPQSYFSIGSFPEALPLFRDLMLNWLDDCPALRRLAFGGVLMLPVPDRDAGFSLLGAYIPVHLDPFNARDFLFQINRPRESRVGVPRLEVNRLSKWAVASYELQATDGEGRWPLAKQDACLLELDINTAAEFQGALPADKYQDLFKELVALAQEIIIEGDRP